ncbi:hypothetical protein CC99x_001330 [Candidatus Berkiella cookevillensis]|uniref:GTPase n=1 Tax=Candidatus Berkiella cookevillensis TaxID=437022 RepID=A0A0Q9YG84_9GAMM|nr:hypothetical protein [Candidatus Berkiella cookevillensis]MCS5707539.1 hypothetical protein [Candidatus Berkiella cookevillensis]
MKYEKGKLGLIIPSRVDNTYNILSVQDVREWRTRLPLNHLKESIKSCHEILIVLHNSHVAPLERLEMLEIIQPTVNFLCESILKLYRKNPIFNKKIIEMHRIILSLHLEVFNEYKLILEDLNTNLSKKETLMEVVHASIQQSCRIIFLSFEIYRHPPSYIWLETHRLYSIARAQEAHYDESTEKNTYQSIFKNISNLYKHLVLLSLTNPLRYHRQDLIKLYYALENWAPLLKLSFNKQSKNHLFKIDLEKDAPPHYCALDASEGSAPCYIELDKIVERLEFLIDYKENASAHTNNIIFTAQELSLSKTTLDVLLHIWQNFSQRQEVRVRMPGALTVAVGLHAIHSFIETANSSQLNMPDEISVEEINLDAFPLPQSLAENFKETPTLLNCSMVDKSDSGYCIKWAQNKAGQLQVGELVGILEQNENHASTWQIAIIRWVQITDFDYILFGVEVLSRKATAVEILIRDQSSLDALFITPDANSPYNTQVLITPTLRFKAADQLQLKSEDTLYPCQLNLNLGLSPCYAFWEIDFLEQSLIPKINNEINQSSTNN